jgi:farnesyl-diphosphate farnesyltransferase
MNYLRLDELYSMVQVKMQMKSLKVNLKPTQTDLLFCYDILQHVSRSFAAVIIQLNDELRDAVCIFYLVLRGLDTVEDDMDIPIPTKKIELPVFHEKLYDDKWCIDGIGKGKERTLLQEFYRVSREFMKLKKEYREVISDICKKMADGMCHFLDTPVQTKKDYDLYCHYVAGLVGHGLTRLFAFSGLESPALADDLTVANHMGLFLQKTNIIRDYFEDISENPPRIFWPREIWSSFTTDIHNFKHPEHLGDAKECLHAMIADALVHVPYVIEYMASLKERSVFLFCAIPQVMAIATLAKLYNNKGVFCDKVKIRKGLACKIMLNCDTLERALAQFSVHLAELETALNDEDPSYDLSRSLCQQSRAALNAHLGAAGTPSYARSFITYYPALGGQLLYNIVDGVGGYFRKQ